MASLHKKGYRVLVVATSRRTRGGITSVVKAYQQGEQWEKYHCKWIESHIDKGRCVKIWWLIKGLTQYLCLLPSYDLVHIHLSEPMSAIRKCLFFFPARLFGKKVIVHFHAAPSETTISGKFRPLYRWLFAHADRVVVLSEIFRKEVEKSLGIAENVRVIFNPCVVEPSDRVYVKDNAVLFAGTVRIRKGYADLINAFGKIANKHPQWVLRIAGNGEIEQGRELAKNLNIEKQVEFLGWVNGEDKDKVFKQSSIFCLPSYTEGFSMAVLDAWAYGLPVITTPVGGIQDVAVDGENVLLFTPGKVDELASKLDLLMSNTGLRETIAANSSNMAATIFNVSSVNKQVASLYEEVLDRAD